MSARGLLRLRSPSATPRVSNRTSRSYDSGPNYRGPRLEFLPRQGEPVSYTHLDVYKRQAQRLDIKRVQEVDIQRSMFHFGAVPTYALQHFDVPLIRAIACCGQVSISQEADV